MYLIMGLPEQKVFNNEKKPKRIKKVMTLNEKVQILDKCREGLSYAAVGRMFCINESTVRYIQKQETEIREAVSTGGIYIAKYTAYVRDKVMLKMENDLFIWIKDQHQKNLPLNVGTISAKALVLFNKYKRQTPSTSNNTETNFSASKGWFHKFKRRYSICNLKNIGEGELIFTDHKADKVSPSMVSTMVHAFN